MDGVVAEDFEEGEIVDDDFEDISDDSIILSRRTGKCAHLRGLSLSSLEEVEASPGPSPPPPLQRHCRRRHRHRSPISISDSDDDDSVPRDKHFYQKQLKAAVQVHVDKQACHNSLKDRLKLLTAEAEPLKPTTEEETSAKDDEDSELFLLRVEALKTTFINKSKSRKRRKNQEDNLSDIEVKSDTSETNKENLEDKAELNHTQEEDEDVLRAMLLASMSKKITEDKTEDVAIDIVPSKRTRLQKTIIPKSPEIKPLIISLNSDSESDDNENTKNGQKLSNVELQKTVDMFLKEQRAQVEAKHALQKQKNDNNKMIKSAVKLLPKDKQLEYHKLLQKLALAKKSAKSINMPKTEAQKKVVKKLVMPPKPETKNLVETTSNGIKAKVVRKTITVQTTTNIEVQKQQLSNNNKTVLPTKNTEGTKKLATPQKLDKAAALRRDILAFRKLYKDMQTDTNGRLQIQPKYKSLRPALAAALQINARRRDLDKKVTELLEEVRNTRLGLDAAQTEFHAQVLQIARSKRLLDRSPEVPKAPTIVEPQQHQNTINFGDPNDIHRVLGIPKAEPPSLGQYISPLDSQRSAHIDPLEILCPFSIDGNCRDSDCSYKHIL